MTVPYMKPIFKKIFCSLALALFPYLVWGQFYLSDTDPASTKWNSLSNKDFQVIYPVGCDSLAMKCLRELNKYHLLDAASISYGVKPFMTVKQLPVILHTQNGNSNGEVTWAPGRMNLITMPEWDSPSAVPWHTMLSIHEGRHVAQMTALNNHVFKGFDYVFGEMFSGAMAGVYPGRLLLEGDAVVAETALTQNGRGRNANFLTYYMYAFDHGDYRNWTKWRLGSYYNVSPDHYAFGYMVLSGIRIAYNDPLFVEKYFDYISRRPYNPYPFRFNLKKVSGKPFKQSYKEIVDLHYNQWKNYCFARGSFMTFSQISKKTNDICFYSNPNKHPTNGTTWVKKDSYHVPFLVQVDSTGREKKLLRLPYTVGRMTAGEADNILLWNEVRKDPRWGNVSKSTVVAYDLNRKKKKVLNLLGDYFYPIRVGRDSIVAIRHLENGSSYLSLICVGKRRELDRCHVPDSIQLVEITHIGSDIYAAGITQNGFGIWKTDWRKWELVLPAIPVKIGAIDHDEEDALLFESDWNGTWEYYRYDLKTKEFVQLSNTKYGAFDYSLEEEGLYFSAISKKGSVAALTANEDLVQIKHDWADYYRWAIADSLSAQEARVIADKGIENKELGPVTGPKRYHKAGHGIRIHSWAPLYADLDALQSMSYDNVKKAAHLGAMAMFQNNLSTLSGYIGYKAAYDQNGKWWHSGHLNLAYTGLYPVFEAEVHVNERNSINYTSYYGKTTYKVSDKPYVNSRLRVYIPLSWSRRSATFGFIPSVSMNLTNDTVNEKNNLLFSIGMRSYFVQNIPEAGIYPRWGGGIEAKWIDPFGYIYGYVYFPGIGWGQGLKLSALHQGITNENGFFVSGYANLMPRGLSGTQPTFYEGSKLSCDYAIPFPIGDWNIGTAFYCKRGILTPHYDSSFLKYNGSYGNLYSVGATLELEFGAFCWVRTPITVGFTYSYNDGNMMGLLKNGTYHYYGATFNIDLPQ